MEHDTVVLAYAPCSCVLVLCEVTVISDSAMVHESGFLLFHSPLPPAVYSYKIPPLLIVHHT